MARTYFKEGSKKEPGRVDFKGLGEGAISGLEEVATERQAKRDDIDSSIAQTDKILSERPEGEHDGATSYWLNHSDNAQKQMLEKENLLKRGKLDPREFTIFNNNIATGTQQVSDAMKSYQKVYGEKMERSQTGKSANLESYEMERIEQYSNLDESALWVDPKTGVVSLIKKVKQPDGSWAIVDEPQNKTSIANLKRGMGGTYDKFQADEVLKSGADKLGTYVEAIMGGGVSTWEDIKNNPEWEKQKTTFIDSLMTDNENVASVLTDSSLFAEGGKQYQYTDNAEAADDDHSLIHVTRNPSTGRAIPNLKSWHKEAAKDYLTTRYESMIQSKQKAWSKPAGRAPSAEQVRGKRELKNSMGFIKGMDKMISGTESESEAAAENLRQGMNRHYLNNRIDVNVDEIDRDESGNYTISVTKKGVSDKVQVNGFDKEGSPRPKEDVIAELYNHLAPTKDVSYSAAMDNFNNTEGNLSDSAVSKSPYSVKKAFKPVKSYGLDQPVMGGGTARDYFSKESMDSPENAAEATQRAFNDALQKIGITAEVTDMDIPRIGTDSFNIKLSNGTVIAMEYDNAKSASKIKTTVDAEIRKAVARYNRLEGEPDKGEEIDKDI